MAMRMLARVLFLSVPLVAFSGTAGLAVPAANQDSSHRAETIGVQAQSTESPSASQNENAVPGAILADAADDWDAVKARLSSRRRQLFEERPEPEVKKMRGLELRSLIPRVSPGTARGELPMPEGETLPEAPPRTPEQQSELEKSQALRNFRIERKSDFEEELQDFLDAR